MSDWKIEFDQRARRELEKLGHPTAQRILRFLSQRVAGSADPTQFGKALTGPYAGLWRYRVSDWRIVVRLERHRLVVLVLRVGHRR
ncbi:MAG: type II toxin-antitoxin system RelE/ParE family toxin [Reyranellales bacterium]